MYRYFTMPIERPSLPNAQAWYQRLIAREAYKTHVMIDWHGTKILVPDEAGRSPSTAARFAPDITPPIASLLLPPQRPHEPLVAERAFCYA